MNTTPVTATAPAQECQICISPITHKNNTILCPIPSCKFAACVTCYIHYVQDNPGHRARCMEPSCKKEFTKQFIHNHFPKSFRNTAYRHHLSEIYFQQQLPRMPETQDLIIRKDRHNDRIKQLKMIHKADPENNHVLLLLAFYNAIMKGNKYADESVEPPYMENLEECWEYATNYIETGVIYPQNHPKQPREYKTQYCSKCPAANCRGFIVNNPENNTKSCGICHVEVCPTCFVQLPNASNRATAPSHVCDQNTVMSIKSIAEETKPCPKCCVPIYKTEGCAQMWCVKCHTAFSWNTGEIETQIHNPHYIDWMFAEAAKNPQPPVLQYNNHMRYLHMWRQFGHHTTRNLHETLREKFVILKYVISGKSPVRPTPSLTQIITDDQLHKMVQAYYTIGQGITHFEQVARHDLQLDTYEKTTEAFRERYLRQTTKDDANNTQHKKELYHICQTFEYRELIHEIIQSKYVTTIKHIFENFLHDITYRVKLSNDVDVQQFVINYNQQLHCAVMEVESELDIAATLYPNNKRYILLTSGTQVRIYLTGQRTFLKNSEPLIDRLTTAFSPHL